MTNYWYIAHPNELFIDTDNVQKSIKHTQARLQGAIESRKLYVTSVMSMPSTKPNHLHTIITLRKSLSNTERHIWEIILHGDIYRGCCNLMRGLRGIPAPDVLISPHSYFYTLPPHPLDVRHADASCECKEKHNKAIMETCPAAIKIRGKYRTAAFFGKPSKNPCTIWRLPEL